jgi:N6-L-threonylcarbamoyladenine synthase
MGETGWRSRTNLYLYDECMDGKGRLGGLILGIESSCDETAAAVVREGREVLSNVVASQIALHANYGGVVPELASREHLRNIVPVVRAAMAEAERVSPGLTFADLDAIAVTEGPGLAGALLVGITYAKALARGLGKPLIAVNHLEGHIHAVLMQAREVKLEMPLLALVVSGGHTHLYLAETSGSRAGEGTGSGFTSGMTNQAGLWRYRNVGRTVDDAAGEAFDKVAKLLGLGYPGGPWMDALAEHGNARAVEFHFGQIKPRAPRPGIVNKKAPGLPADGPTFDFSFSGIKTAVLRYVQSHGMRERVEARRAALTEALEMPGLFDAETLDLIASFQYAVVGNLMRQTFAAAEAFGARGIVISGGVSANSELRRRFAEEAGRRGLPVAFPTVAMSTDNAAMIAAAAWPKFCAGEFAAEGLVAMPQLRLG